MTAKSIEELLLRHATGLATLEERTKSLGERLIDFTEANEVVVTLMREDIGRQTIEISDLTLRLALVEKEAADLKQNGDRGRAFRTSVLVALIGALLSFAVSAIIALYIKPK